MSQPSPYIVVLPPNSSGVQVDGISLPANVGSAGQSVYRGAQEIALPVSSPPLRFVGSQIVQPNSIGSAFTLSTVASGKTGYIHRVKFSSTGFVTGGTGSGYTLCASGCNAPITASPIIVLETTHLQGVNAFAYAFDAMGNQVFPNVARNSEGDLTITYTIAPSRIVIMGPGSTGTPSCLWTIMAGVAVLGYSITTDGDETYEPPHRFFDQCPQGSAFSFTPSNPTGSPLTAFCTAWWDQF